MDYLLFLTGLFLLTAAISGLFLFRDQCHRSRWALFAAALVALCLKVWYGILVFAVGGGALVNVVHSFLGCVFAASLLGFCLSSSGPGQRLAAPMMKWAAMATLGAVVFCAGLYNPNSIGFIAPLIATGFGGGWKLAGFLADFPGARKPYHPVVTAMLLATIVGLCLQPDMAGVCYDIHGQGRLPSRIMLLAGFGLAAGCSLLFCWIPWSAIYQANHHLLARALARRRRIGTAVILAAAAITLVSGAWLAHWLGDQTDQEQTSTILSALHLGANNFDVGQIQQIQGAPKEINSPGYISLHGRLREVRDALPGVRFAYLLGLRNQQFVFLVDAEDPAHTETFSPPGEPVKDYPEKWQPELAGASTFNGPDRDEWGVWFAACVPILDSGGNVIALLGIDYPAAKWLQPVATRRLAAMVVTLSVALLLIAMFGFHVITTEKEHNLLLSRAEADRLALVAKRTDNAVVITDTAGRIEWVNEGFVKISGYSKDEVMGKTPGSILQRQAGHSTERMHTRACIEKGMGFETEILNYSKSGHAYIVHIECQPLVDKQGVLTGFMAIERDVTQAHRSSNLLEAVAATSTTLLSNRLESGVWGEILTALGTAANADRCYLFQIHPHTVLGTPAMSQTAEWNSGTATPQINNPQLQNSSFHENGYDRWLTKLLAGHVICGVVADFPASEQPMLIAQEIRSLVVVPIFTGEQLTGLMGFDACHEDRVWENWEISILRSAAANIGLRHIVQNEADALVLARDEARTAALAAESANRAKSTFLATMSHEIRNPLNAIVGMASLLETSAIDPHQQEIVVIIRNASNILLELINDILDYSRIESGNIDLDPKPFNLADLCHEALDVVRPAIMGKDLKLTCQFAPHLPAHVTGDRARIRQILVNLLGNAVKFTPQGVISLRVFGQQSDDGPWQFTFDVKDSGIGITPDAIGRLFNPFTQADSSTTRRFGGSGLGLSISKRLVEIMGGDITVRSVLGQGSTFRVNLALSAALEPLETLDSQVADSMETSRIADLQVLVVEDEPNNQKVIRMFLKRLGFEADVVSDGQQGVAAASAKSYDIIFLDLQMPVMDGLEACRRIREMKLVKRPYIVAITANAFREDCDAAYAAGMDDYLAKPITMPRLRVMVDKITKGIHSLPEPLMRQLSAESVMPAITAEPVLVDIKQLDALIIIGAEGYRDVLQDLMREVPVHIANIRTLIEIGDMPSFKCRIHKFKGVLGFFGCVAMTSRLDHLHEQDHFASELAVPIHAELTDLWDKSLIAIRQWELSVPSLTT
jgi:PAS domain S-box-containing protein